MRHILKNIYRKIFPTLSQMAVGEFVNSDPAHKAHWDYSLSVLPSLYDHFSSETIDKEVEYRIRFLVTAESAYMEKEILSLIEEKGSCRYADIGDSDGSVRLILEKKIDHPGIETLGVNLQKEAIKKIEEKGLKALYLDCMDLDKTGHSFDIISVFEVLEHLNDPIGFLTRIHNVCERMIISVPYVRKSRISCLYVTDKWPSGIKADIESVHIFELSPVDWEKLFKHSGWRIVRQKKVLQYPKKFPLNLVKYIWRYMSFEGFWFVTLTKDETYSSMYVIE